MTPHPDRRGTEKKSLQKHRLSEPLRRKKEGGERERKREVKGIKEKE
jgi:hypothetical protein